jgi:hypothetical protein
MRVTVKCCLVGGWAWSVDSAALTVELGLSMVVKGGAHGRGCLVPWVLRLYLASKRAWWAQQPSSELMEGVGAAHAQKRVSPKEVPSLPRAVGACPAVLMRPSRSPPDADGAVRPRWRRPMGFGW